MLSAHSFRYTRFGPCLFCENNGEEKRFSKKHASAGFAGDCPRHKKGVVPCSFFVFMLAGDHACD